MKVELTRATVREGDLYYVPEGFFVISSPTNAASVVGFRRAHVRNSAFSKDQLETALGLREADYEISENLQPIQFFIQELSARMAACTTSGQPSPSTQSKQASPSILTSELK